ncbi:MAG: hypothetical protein AVDCRST_MAG19-193 [uncultured Thermomicrobiales bacterium]|uniref:Uncharacterized protein n=1 Tax=uncultured Thermomicrobiales bacterium TaxID=1645740 RepID=A0A6J4UC99_9BACT|nr:MAG: hypothetical protein AVDCRST_MAG19-193 [uncultured Thermomicrobiales bacterium]
MVRRPERLLAHKRRPRREEAAHAVDPGHLQRLGDGHRRQDRGERPRHERLAEARRARRQDVRDATPPFASPSRRPRGANGGWRVRPAGVRALDGYPDGPIRDDDLEDRVPNARQRSGTLPASFNTHATCIDAHMPQYAAARQVEFACVAIGAREGR